MASKLEELLNLDENYLKSTLIKFFSDDDLKRAVPIMDEERRRCVEKELNRRKEEQGNFTAEEWERFRIEWNEVCRKLRGGK